MRSQRGLAPAVEAAVIIPGLVLLVGLVVVFARIVMAQHDLDAVAGNAARAVSMARDAAHARTSAAALVAEQLQGEGLRCEHTRVDIDAAGLRAALGSNATVSVTVECAVSMADVVLPGVPGSVTVRAHVESPVDKFRGR
ncbi:TadE/TadG family type IV pilus assembly protein [uncultured Tessaracoccus sp.]|uniref:TadE/TadG family type IV pilus assembly protein n=1 Tax=uncultured Tessaracoccus sp. TaxID=905023 RepID=UPI00261B123C|nr:TadE/TadG family type IV pilus assembly protein [uncultured Tessaracoccus sp.]